MISGHVSSTREATITLSIYAATREHVDISAIIDTGFTGFLTLPASTIARLKLSSLGARKAMLADGTIRSLDVFRGALAWGDREREVLILSADGSPLVGMSLLYGFRLTVDVVDGGAVAIEEIG